MAKIRSALKEISIPNMIIGTQCWVDITTVHNPHSFYVRPRAFRAHLPFLQARGEKIEPSEIRLGDIHIFKSRILRCYARGKVIKIDGDTEPLYKLLAIDWGCIEADVSIHRIWQLYHNDRVPGLVTQCQLADCLPLGDTWDAPAIDAFKSFVEGERAKIIIRSKAPGPVRVELINSCPDDIATLLAISGYTKFRYQHNCPLEFPMLMAHYNVPRKLELKTPLRVIMVSGKFPDSFHVILAEEWDTYMQDRNDFRYYCQEQETMRMDQMKIGGLVAVYSNIINEYERGIITNLYPSVNKIRLRLVDKGIEIVDHVSKMKPVPEWYLRIPARAIHCTVHPSQFLAAKTLTQYTNSAGHFMISIQDRGRGYGPSTVILGRVTG